MRIILASGSPRRKELMESLGLQFEIIPAKGEEKSTVKNPSALVVSLSMAKALEIAQTLKSSGEECIVIGADTVVSVDNNILGKPAGRTDCINMIKKLSGRVHKVFTGVTVIYVRGYETKTDSFFECTDVEFYKIADDEIADYAAHEYDSWHDKAGAYGIQEPFGSKYIKSITGNYDNVVGLPASVLYNRLKTLGYI